MQLKLTTLSENTAGSGLVLAEWGLSILIETETMAVLLDTGQSLSTGYNADILGVDLSKVDRIVLSHGHYDHTGGLRPVLQKMRKEVEVVAHPDIWAPKYARRRNQPDRYIGIPFQRADLESLGARFNLGREPVRLAENIMTTGEVPLVTDFESIDPFLVVKEGADFKPDDLLDDRAIIISTGSGLVVVLGCAHRGMINTLYHAQQLTGVKEINLVIGGCHLIGAKEERIWQTITALKELRVGRIGISHCTGLPAAAIMAQEFGENFFFNNAGNRIELS
jgi:7,8-dihydropterin-6-yl-methyl-4-(beta-D-ribofuranosyl)aminobenzene 5'-phosphate synthase